MYSAFLKLLFVFVFFYGHATVNGQVLQPGDIAIVAVNVESNSSGNDDEFSMIGLDTIPTNTAIDITDNGWEQSNTGEWGNQEGIIRIRRTGPALEPGEAFTLYGDGSQPGDFVVLPDSNNWVVETLDSTNDFDLTVGDQIWILQGGSWDRGTGVDDGYYSGTVIYGWTATGWAGDPQHGSPGTTTYSELYPNMACLHTKDLTLQHKAKYNGLAHPANKRIWLNRIKDPNYWDDKNTSQAFYNSTPKYIEGVHFDVTPDSLPNGTWVGDYNNNWFDCNNWSELAVPQEQTNVEIGADAHQFVVISSDAQYSDMFNDTATCHNLNINVDSVVLEDKNDRIVINGDLFIDGGVLSPHRGRVFLKGNWNNISLNHFRQAQSMVSFCGINLQTITSIAGNELFNRINIDNSSHVKMQSNVKSDTLHLIYGNLFLDNYELLVSDTILGGSSNSYCATKNDPATGGYLHYYAATDQTLFPVGTQSSYTPLRITTQGATAEYKVRTFDNLYENGYSGNMLTGDIVNRSWAVEQTSATAYPANISLQWNVTEESAGFSTNRSMGNMIYNNANGSGTGWDDWNYLLNSTPPSGTGPFNIVTTNIIEFGIFGITGDRCLIARPDTPPIYHF